MRFRKRPVVVDAILFTGTNSTEVEAWIIDLSGRNKVMGVKDAGRFLTINTLEGTMTANPGDWIIRGVSGEYYPCKPEIFAATYEATP